MTIRSIPQLPFTLNVLYRDPGEIITTTYATVEAALKVAREEVEWENTVHASVTDERTGVEVF